MDCGFGFRRVTRILSPDMVGFRDERVKQVTIGVVIFLSIAVVAVTSLVGWRLLPGLLGEWIGVIVGILSTPVFLEISFAILGLMIVLALNHWRQHKDGDEFVYLEQVEGPNTPADLPEQAKWAIFREEPLAAGDPSLLAQAEGAFALGDHQAAAELIAQMNRDELIELDVLRLRLALAQASGRDALARQLEIEIRSVSQENLSV
jgi:uncharacterized membrane protein